ncbi:glycoside hydrolase family 28 protein [Halalkalibaculum sp. DA3122]|uniref:glycoside hydrolase family 28 protein n=1 Tax=unclassified Halalkalibaculum TaxID=2964617 RepID=UPI0037542494
MDLFAQQRVITKDIEPLDAPFPMAELQRPGFPDTTFNIQDYGAVPLEKDSSFKNTGAIHRAIEAAHDIGGGTIVIPKGGWLTGPIHLMSNINLYIADGATVYFSTDKEDYLPVVPQRYEGVEAYNYSPLIYARNVKNVAVIGRGTLDAQGAHWWSWFEEHGAPPRGIATKVPLSRRDFGKGAGNEGMRPNFMVFWKSEDILVEGITLNDSPMWNVHLVYSKRAIIRNITVNSLDAPNGDGVVLDSSRDILVEYNHFETGDDAVVLKSGFNEEGLQIDIPTKNVVVRNFEARDVRTGSGGIVFGSETSGGINNVYVHNAYFEGADRGIRFKTERGRGNVIEDIFIRNIRMRDIENQAINFNTFYTGPEATGPAPLIRNIEIRDVQIDSVPTAISLIGLPEKWLENITLQNIQVSNAGEGARIERVKNLTLHNVDIQSEERAMIVNDVYEMYFENVALSDSMMDNTAPILLQGSYTGSIFMPNFPASQIEFGEDVSPNIIKREPQQQVW